ncbi:MAG TPA: papain-like cysteine protease family protein, partial [Vicinamibacteria bacterium]|nr:papain-like cysteine protease family protein [Vicinamibacteria bacterium]
MLSLALLAAAALQVPFVPQQKDTCGAAALAMVLRYYGQPVSHDAIAAQLVEPELRGIRGSRLEAFARERGMLAIAFAGDLDLARQHLAKGRPLIVALAAGGGQYHDVVLIGLDDERHRATVNDPALGPGREVGERELDRRWEKTSRWTLLVQPAAEALTMPEPAGAPGGGTAPTAPSHATRPSPGGALSYPDLVSMAVDQGRAGDTAEAVALLDRAIAKDPSRPEAWVERGGLHFLDRRYDQAIADLRQALARRDEAYTRELLGSSLQLAGRPLEALAVWNTAGRPTLAEVEIAGLRKTRDEVARREIGLAPGALVTPAALRAARRRLAETTAFERITLRPRPLGDGTADLEVALTERHGLAHGLPDFLVATAIDVGWQRLGLRYSNLAGSGISLGGFYRWQENRPAAELDLQAPRPFGVLAYLRLAAVRGEQAYDIGSTFAIRRRGVDLGLRHVLDGGAVLSLSWHARDRSVANPRPDAPPGRLEELEVGLEVPVLETARQRLDAAVRLSGAGPALASDLS